MRRISLKRQSELKEYHILIERIGNVSDLSGLPAEHHHITGCNGKRLTNPFNIICLTRAEHDNEQAHHTYERERELLAIVRPIREGQGFRRGDYPEL
jgi:hypothetical protein